MQADSLLRGILSVNFSGLLLVNMCKKCLAGFSISPSVHLANYQIHAALNPTAICIFYVHEHYSTCSYIAVINKNTQPNIVD
jgi:hypothetical protein